MTETNTGPTPRPFRILTLDGGGIRGAFAAAFLADLEHRLQCRVGDYFDLVVGTSTGGIIGAAIALGEPANRIEKFYREKGPMVFRRRWEQPTSRWRRVLRSVRRLPARVCDRVLRRFGLDCDWLRRPKYDTVVLRESLEEVFGNRTMEDAQTCRLLINSVDLTRGQTIVFKTPHLPGMVRDRHYRIADIILATTAAPTYFPHAVIGEGSAFVDGGVWANNPSMVAVAESLQIKQKCQRDGIDPVFNLESVQLLAIGTGKAPLFAVPPPQGAGVAWWAKGLLDLVSITQAQGVHFQSKYILNDRYQRIDFDVPDGSWRLDAVDRLSQLIHLGHNKSAEEVSRLKPLFFTERAEPYNPFPDVGPEPDRIT